MKAGEYLAQQRQKQGCPQGRLQTKGQLRPSQTRAKRGGPKHILTKVNHLEYHPEEQVYLYGKSWQVFGYSPCRGFSADLTSELAK